MLQAFKFEHKRGASADIARCLDLLLPKLDPTTIVVYLPTANVRVRERGFDQAKLIAQNIAHARGILYAPLLQRVHDSRQVGFGRKDRFISARQAFKLKNGSGSALVRGSTVLLVDDVITTGASLEAAASILRKHGAKHVSAVVFAQSII